MVLSEAKKLLEENGYIVEKQLLTEDWGDLISFIFSAYFAWAGFQTVGGLIQSCRDPGGLKDVIERIETNKDLMVKTALYTLHSSNIPSTLQIKLESLSYDQLKFLIKKGLLEGESEAETNYGMTVRNLQDKPAKIRDYGEYIITLYTDILYEALHDDDIEIKKQLKSHLVDYKKLTTIKNKFKNMWNTLKFMWSSKKSDKEWEENKIRKDNKKRIKLYKQAEKKFNENPILYKEKFDNMKQKYLEALFTGDTEEAIKYVTDFLNDNN